MIARFYQCMLLDRSNLSSRNIIPEWYRQKYQNRNRSYLLPMYYMDGKNLALPYRLESSMPHLPKRWRRGFAEEPVETKVEVPSVSQSAAVKQHKLDRKLLSYQRILDLSSVILIK